MSTATYRQPEKNEAEKRSQKQDSVTSSRIQREAEIRFQATVTMWYQLLEPVLLKFGNEEKTRS